jgi:hypothetical protein
LASQNGHLEVVKFLLHETWTNYPVHYTYKIKIKKGN